jgi:hypothetical protein
VPGIDECLLEAMRLPGARGAALVDWTSGLALGTVGESPGGDHEATAAEAAELARMAAEHRCFTSAGHRQAPENAGTSAAPATTATATSTSGTTSHPHPRHAAEVQDPPLEDLIISNRDSYHVLRFVGSTFDSSVVLHLWLARAEGNLALARIRLGEMAGRLVLG